MFVCIRGNISLNHSFYNGNQEALCAKGAILFQ